MSYRYGIQYTNKQLQEQTKEKHVHPVEQRQKVIVSETINLDPIHSQRHTSSSIIPASPERENTCFPGLFQTQDETLWRDAFGKQDKDENKENNSAVVSKKKVANFTEQEDALIEEGYKLFGENWEAINNWGGFSRGPSSIKGRWARLALKKKRLAEKDLTVGYSSPQMKLGVLESISNLSNQGLFTSQENTPTKKCLELSSKYLNSEYGVETAPSSPYAPPRMKRIDEYFTKKNQGDTGKTKKVKAADKHVSDKDLSLERLKHHLASSFTRIQELESIVEASKKENEELKEALQTVEGDKIELKNGIEQMKREAEEVGVFKFFFKFQHSYDR